MSWAGDKRPCDHATTYKGFLDMIKYLWMWWVIGSAPDFWGRSPGFESGIYHDDPDALQDHCEIKYKKKKKKKIQQMLPNWEQNGV